MTPEIALTLTGIACLIVGATCGWTVRGVMQPPLIQPILYLRAEIHAVEAEDDEDSWPDPELN